MKIKNAISAVVIVTVGFFALATPAQAKTLYQYGDNKFTSTEYNQSFYEGTAQINAAAAYKNSINGYNFTYVGYVSYTRSGQLLGRAWTSYACRSTNTGIRKASMTLMDNLSWNGPVTEAHYDYYTAPVGSVVC